MTKLALTRSRIGFVSTARAAARSTRPSRTASHARADLTSQGQGLASRATDSTRSNRRRRFALPRRRCADRQHATANGRSGYDAHACASGPALNRSSWRADCLGAGCLTPSFQLASLLSAMQPGREPLHGLAASLRSVPLVETTETGGGQRVQPNGDARGLARKAYRE